MRLSRQFRGCLFFFKPKRFERKKAPDAKQTTFTLLKVFVHAKIVAFVVYCLLNFCVAG